MVFGTVGHAPIVRASFWLFSGPQPRWRRTSGADDLAHGVVKVHFQDLDKEVDGVAGEVALRPAPIAFFEDETGEGGQFEVARLLFDKLQAALLQQRYERGLSGSADLF